MGVLLNVTVKCDHAGCDNALQTTASATADVESVPEDSELDFVVTLPAEWAQTGKDGAYCPDHIPSWRRGKRP